MKILLTYLLIISQTHDCFARSNIPDLNLHNNQLSGQIPSEIGNLTNLNGLLRNELITEFFVGS